VPVPPPKSVATLSIEWGPRVTQKAGKAVRDALFDRQLKRIVVAETIGYIVVMSPSAGRIA